MTTNDHRRQADVLLFTAFIMGLAIGLLVGISAGLDGVW
jgi:hypothetical protein